MSRLDFCSWALEYEDFIARGTVENQLLDMDKIESFIDKSLDAPDYMFIAQVPHTGWSPHDVESINFDDYTKNELHRWTKRTNRTLYICTHSAEALV